MKALLTPEDWYTKGGPHPKTQANWRVLGKGPKFIKVGGLVRYDPDDISEWNAARRVSSTSQSIAA